MCFQIIIFDNQDITRAGLRGYIFEWFAGPTVECVASKEELVGKLTERQNSVVIIDYALSDFRSVDQFLVFATRFGKANWIIFTNSFTDELVHRLASEPNIGLLLKDCCESELRAALDVSCKGGKYVCDAIREYEKTESLKIKQELTPTEVEILKLIALGRSAKEIAAERVSSIHTITTHKKNIFRKLDVNNVHEATKYALRAGLIELVDYYI